ncbi:MAG TPA: type II toxin-antitoxin system Phd/YefM family antitoxin [Chloroflexota bacterium]|nr:type II toxin-antitoxin system Phd/YefM family antitoxin [Chloroflexota bacterium]HUM69762.1 type II toxin-antitoxin system Phd/YefM family antitoxin [Chloroflexota bacterium]
MTVLLIKSSEVQQNFGRVIDQALSENEVVVERYGEPRVAILSYRRYQQLLQAEQATAVYTQLPNRSEDARQQGEAAAQQIRQEISDRLGESLEAAMGDLRGRAWSS